jgi:hypothetical protein
MLLHCCRGTYGYQVCALGIFYTCSRTDDAAAPAAATFAQAQCQLKLQRQRCNTMVTSTRTVALLVAALAGGARPAGLAFYASDPLLAAALLEASLRTQACEDLQCWRDANAVINCDIEAIIGLAFAAANQVQFVSPLVSALQTGWANISSSCPPPEALLAAAQQLASLLETCLKCYSGALMVREHRWQLAAQLGQPQHSSLETEGFVSEVHAILLVVGLIRQLCSLFETLWQDELAARLAGPAPGELGSSSSSRSGSSSAAESARDWVVLAAKSLLALAWWTQQQPAANFTMAALFAAPTARAGSAAASQGRSRQQLLPSPSPEQLRMQSVRKAVMPSCSELVNWLSTQLLVLGLPGQDNAQPAAAPPPQQQQLKLLLKQGAAAGVAVQRAEQLLALQPSHCNELRMQLKFDDCCQQLKSFAEAVLDQCPVASSCGNPNCFNMQKLSEWQLVSGKACVRNGCGAVTYCSKACQKLMWAKHHRPVCMRLQGE